MKKGVLLVNLGSPDSPNPPDVKTYLEEFLMDERVIDAPKWLRTFLVKGIILNTRPKKSAKAYQKIWWEEGSPLIVLSERLKTSVQEKVSVPVALAMRYGSPSIKTGLQQLADQGVDETLIIPLYPSICYGHYRNDFGIGGRIEATVFPTHAIYLLARILSPCRLYSCVGQLHTRVFERQGLGTSIVLLSRGAKTPYPQVRHHKITL